jgi:hypothetical protein
MAWFMALAALTLLATYSAPSFPQDAEPIQPASDEAAEAAAVESILQQQERAVERQFSYVPGNRRDPFRNLSVPDTDTVRPDGAAGMLVAEINLEGIVRDPVNGDVALVIGPDTKGYFLRVGDAVYDGTVIAVDARQGQVIFRQKVDDPKMIKPYRDVPKRLVPISEESSDE